MWNRLRFIRFLQVSQIFQRRKSDANKQDFENKLNLTFHAQSPPTTTGMLTKVFSTSDPNLVALAWTGDELSRRQAQNGVNFYFEVKFDLEGQGQSPSKTIGILTKVFYTSDPNLVALAWTGDELSRRQAQNGVNFYFEVKFDLEGQGQSPSKTIGILTKVFYTYGPNLVILAWTGDELSRGQTWWRTDGQTQATTIPEGQYWPRVKNGWHGQIFSNAFSSMENIFFNGKYCILI